MSPKQSFCAAIEAVLYDPFFQNLRESERETRLRNQLSIANDQIDSLRAKLASTSEELTKNEHVKRASLMDDFVLKVVRPSLESSGAPPWSLGRPNVTPSSPLSRRSGISK